jgi:putative hydrolase of the HAD superfamily
MIKTIVFDFGNVIGFFSHRLASERLARYSDLSVDEIDAILWDSPLEDEYEAGQISTAEFVRKVREMCRLHCPDDVLCAAYADIFQAANPEVVALLPRLKPRYHLLLASNTNQLHARQFLNQFADCLGYFEALVLSHEAGARKPAAAFFEHCQRQVHCTPEECVFIDDLPANVAGARDHGWHGIVYTNAADLRRQLTALGISPV